MAKTERVRNPIRKDGTAFFNFDEEGKKAFEEAQDAKREYIQTPGALNPETREMMDAARAEAEAEDEAEAKAEDKPAERKAYSGPAEKKSR